MNKNNIYSLLNKKSKLSFPKSDTIVDPKQSFKKVVDDFVINEIFSDQNNKINFLKLISDEFGNMINGYILENNLEKNSILFIYKGGNVLRIHFNNQMKLYPQKFSECMKKIFDDNFKKSDDDFTIYINYKIPNYQKVFDDIVYLSYKVLQKIKNELNDNKVKYFSLYSKNEREINKTICDKLMKPMSDAFSANKYIDVYSSDQEIIRVHVGDEDSPYSNYTLDGIIFDNKICDSKNDIKRFTYYNPFGNDEKIQSNEITSNRNDFAIVNEGDLHVIYPFADNKPSSLIYLTYNNTLDFTKETGTKSSFVLLRAKMNCVMFASKDDVTGSSKNKILTGGELIDVSIPKENDDGLIQFYKKIDHHPIDTLITQIQFVGNDNKPFYLSSYTIDYMIIDLQRMLFSDIFFPWNDVKYEKRVYRLWCLYFIKLIIDRNENVEKIFVDVYKYLDDESDKLLNYDLIIKNPILKNFADNYNRIKKESKGYLWGFNDDFIKYIDSVKKIINKIIVCFIEYNTINDLYDPKQKTEFTVTPNSNILGGKYAKYKTKYVNAKKELETLKNK